MAAAAGVDADCSEINPVTSRRDDDSTAVLKLARLRRLHALPGEPGTGSALPEDAATLPTVFSESLISWNGAP
jgi:hypothetical protein